MRNASADIEEVHKLVLEIEVESIRHLFLQVFLASKTPCYSSTMLLNDRESHNDKEQRVKVLNSVYHVVGCHSEVIDPVDFESEVHSQVGVVEVADDLADTADDEPVQDVLALHKKKWREKSGVIHVD